MSEKSGFEWLVEELNEFGYSEDEVALFLEECF